MAAVPSVVYGLWGLFFFQANVIPVAEWISTYFSWIPIFRVSDADGTAMTDASAFTSSATDWRLRFTAAKGGDFLIIHGR
jgi:phosphate transport system permease protein